MDVEKFRILKEIINRWDVDIERGTVSTQKGNKHYLDGAGYLRIATTCKGKFMVFGVHQIIACKAGYDLVNMVIDHVNGNKKDNRICNLEVVSASENAIRAVTYGLNHRDRKARNQNSGKTKLTNIDVGYIKLCLEKKIKGVMELADMFKVSHSRISEIKNGITWKEIMPLREADKQ